MAAPAGRVEDDPLLGLAVRTDDCGPIRAHSVFLLVEGTGVTEVEPLGEGQSVTAQSFRDKSDNGALPSERHGDPRGPPLFLRVSNKVAVPFG